MIYENLTEEQKQVIECKARLLGSLLLFTQTFYKLRTGRDFLLSNPVSRESHYISICKELTTISKISSNKLLINVPPRYGKTELLIHFVAWTLAKHPDSNFLYVSYSHTLAKKQTQTIREIIQIPQYKKLFEVEISEDTSAKDNFETNKGGSVYASGAKGTITGRGAGIKNCGRFGGCIVIDDIHKPSEVTSDTMRLSTNEWFYNTLQSRTNSPNTPIIFIGQRLHEDDLAGNLINTGEWKTLIIPALDIHNNALHEEMHSTTTLLKMKEESPYEFSAQYMQEPQPSGGGIFKPEWFILTDEEPKIIASFITADTAETDKSYNDATVFSFFGIYGITHDGIDTDLYGLHWIDCIELRVEPKDLKNEFIQFYSECMRHKIKPKIAIIERKSTGVTLLSTLSDMQGLQLLDIEKTKSKTTRFLEVQPYVAQKHVSIPRYGKHTNNCIEHCKKITANQSHRFDDIADTLADAVQVALIDKILLYQIPNKGKDNEVANTVMSGFLTQQRIRRQMTGSIPWK